MTHFIRKQFLHIGFTGTEAEGLKVERLAPELFYTELLPELEKTFDSIVPSDKLLKIERLEIDAGTITFDHFSKDFSNAVLREIAQALQDRKDQAKRPDDGIYSETSLEDKSESGANVLLFFLINGRLPWSYRISEGHSLEEDLHQALKSILKSGKGGMLANKLYSSLSAKNVVERIENQFSIDFQNTLLAILLPEAPEIIKRILKENRLKSSSEGNQTISGKKLNKAAFSYFARAEKPNTAGLKSYLNHYLYGSTVAVKAENNKETGLIIETENSRPDLLLGNKRKWQTDDEEGIYIDHAGLVLLHPFIPRFFEGLGIADDVNLKKPDRALHLLQHLVTGKSRSYEFEMVLPKILCGLELDYPVAGGIKISRKESIESMALLDAVIGHWSALRSTSHEGLRETFFYRPGKLITSRENNLILKVESRTYDVLLEELPWGISMIKLPWMKSVLNVEWIF